MYADMKLVPMSDTTSFETPTLDKTPICVLATTGAVTVLRGIVSGYVVARSTNTRINLFPLFCLGARGPRMSTTALLKRVPTTGKF